MIKHFCDLCGRELKMYPTNEERADSDKSIGGKAIVPGWHDALISIYGYFSPTDIEICKSCRWDVDNWLREMTKKFKKEFPRFTEPKELTDAKG